MGVMGDILTDRISCDGRPCADPKMLWLMDPETRERLLEGRRMLWEMRRAIMESRHPRQHRP